MKIHIVDSCSVYCTGLKLIIEQHYPQAQVVQSLLPGPADVFRSLPNTDILLVHIPNVTQDLAGFLKCPVSTIKKTKTLVICDRPNYWHTKRLFGNGIKGQIPLNANGCEIKKATDTILAGHIYVEVDLLINLVLQRRAQTL